MNRFSIIRRPSQRTRRGIAAVEFALVLPILLILLLGGLDLTRSMLYHQKTERIAFSVADLVTQSSSLTAPQLQEMLQAAAQIMLPFTFGANGVVIVTSVYKDPNQTYPTIRWQASGGGTLARASKIGILNGTPALPGGLRLNDKDNVVVVETYFVFAPTFNSGLVRSGDLYKVAVYKPRLGALLSLPNS